MLYRKLLIYIIFPCILPYGDFTRESLYIRVWNYLRYSLGIEKCPKVYETDIEILREK